MAGRSRLWGGSVLVALVLSFASSAAALNSWSDSISTDPPAPDQIDGSGWWDGGDPGPPPVYQASVLSWEISDLGTHVHYEYTWTHPEHDASYFILEVSENFTIDDVLAVYNDGTTGFLTLADVEVNTYYDDGSNYQFMPASIWAVKFDAFTSYTDNGDGTITETISFDSTRLPTWGDFYARCGIHPSSPEGRGVWDAAWNVGFLNLDDTDADDGFPRSRAGYPRPRAELPAAAGLRALRAGRGSEKALTSRSPQGDRSALPHSPMILIITRFLRRPSNSP